MTKQQQQHSMTWRITTKNAKEFFWFFAQRGFTFTIPTKVRVPVLELVRDGSDVSLFLDKGKEPLCKGAGNLTQAFREFTTEDFDTTLADPVLVPGRKLKASGRVPDHVACYLKDEVRYPVFARVSGYAVQWRYEDPDTKSHYLLCLARDQVVEADLFNA